MRTIPTIRSAVVLTLLLFAACGPTGEKAAIGARDSAARVAGSAPVAAPAEPFRAPEFTAAQAARGEQIYKGVCARCHLGGQFNGSAIATAWQDRRLSDLYETLSNTMPQDNPGSLTNDQYIDVIAYMLQLNGVAPGKVALRADTAMLRHARFTNATTHSGSW